ncbi:MAG: hypothetical protein FJ138_06630 [Deltaproteobacteria bacterium]|nr:hypothetical protein [Deltaproteobacteria bacterium]
MSPSITPWAELSQRYIQEIKRAAHIYHKARHLKSRLSPGESGETGAALDQLSLQMEALERTRRRLEQGEFRIAVVGLEKAGKSTFVNAWLGYDLLPSDTSRCTFTTTQVFSVLNSHEQRLDVHTKTHDEFNAYISDLKALASKDGDNARRAQADLRTIEEHRANLDEVIAQGRRTFPFSELSDIKENLELYVASPEIAHAVREAHLHTSRLASADGVVFYDVPGLNSGLGKHIEESREMLKDCDAIICIQRSKTPSLEASEQQLIEFARRGDSEVSLADKLFVFLGQIDIEGSAASLSENTEKAYREWQTRAELPRDHLISGTAAGHLMMTNVASDKLFKQVGSREKMATALRDLCGAQGDEALVEACGVGRLKSRVAHYLEHERGHVLSARCDKTLQKIREASERLFNETRQRYPDDPALAERQAEEGRRRKLNEWWRGRWESARKKAYERCEQLITEEVSLNDLREQYTKGVNELFSTLYHRQEEPRDRLFDSRKDQDIGGSNIEWRRRLRTEAQQAIGALATTLTGGFQRELETLMRSFREELWGSDQITICLIGDLQSFEKRVTHGLETLFLRFALPLINVFIQHPVNTESRKKLIKESSLDLSIIDDYYKGKEEALNQSSQLAKHGVALLTHPLLRQAVLKIPVKPGDLNSSSEPFRLEEYPKTAKERNEVITEVEGDLSIVARYIIEAVFSASGLTGYFRQELSRLRDRFMSHELEDLARAIMDGLYHSRDPRLLNEPDFPAELRTKGANLDISAALKELREALSRSVI